MDSRKIFGILAGLFATGDVFIENTGKSELGTARLEILGHAVDVSFHDVGCGNILVTAKGANRSDMFDVTVGEGDPVSEAIDGILGYAASTRYRLESYSGLFAAAASDGRPFSKKDFATVQEALADFFHAEPSDFDGEDPFGNGTGWTKEFGNGCYGPVASAEGDKDARKSAAHHDPDAPVLIAQRTNAQQHGNNLTWSARITRLADGETSAYVKHDFGIVWASLLDGFAVDGSCLRFASMGGESSQFSVSCAVRSGCFDIDVFGNDHPQFSAYVTRRSDRLYVMQVDLGGGDTVYASDEYEDPDQEEEVFDENVRRSILERSSEFAVNIGTALSNGIVTVATRNYYGTGRVHVGGFPAVRSEAEAYLKRLLGDDAEADISAIADAILAGAEFPDSCEKEFTRRVPNPSLKHVCRFRREGEGVVCEEDTMELKDGAWECRYTEVKTFTRS